MVGINWNLPVLVRAIPSGATEDKLVPSATWQPFCCLVMIIMSPLGLFFSRPDLPTSHGDLISRFFTLQIALDTFQLVDILLKMSSPVLNIVFRSYLQGLPNPNGTEASVSDTFPANLPAQKDQTNTKTIKNILLQGGKCFTLLL